MKKNELFGDLKAKFKLADKKLYEILLAAFLIGVLILIVGKDFFSDKSGETKDSLLVESREISEREESIESRISKVLSNIKGAGRVDVLITYDGEGERVYAFENRTNKTESKREESRESDSESKIAFEEDTSGNRKPVLLKEIKPLPQGAVVIADGAYDKTVVRNLSEAVEVLLKLPPHKIQVFERRK